MGFISKSIFEDILSLVLQNRFADIEPMSDPQNEALFEILNPEDVFAEGGKGYFRDSRSGLFFSREA